MTPQWKRKIPAISAVMTPFPYSVDVRAGVETAAEMMREGGFRHLPVLDGDDLVSIVTERDLRQAMRLGGASGSAPKLRDICDREAFVVEMGVPLDEVLRHMERRHLEAAMVVKEGKLAGIFTLTDACRRFAEYLGTGVGDDDDEVA